MSLENTFVCEYCSKVFESFNSVQRHKGQNHKELLTSITCSVCEKVFNNKTALSRHRRKEHVAMVPDLNANRVKCGDCKALLPSVPELCTHLSREHNMDVPIQQLHFKTLEDFEIWKKNVEVENRFSFVCHSGKHKSDIWEKEYLYCFRSGNFVSDSKGVRGPKPSNRINCHCSCFAYVKKSAVTKEISVTCCLQHYGHDDVIVRATTKITKKQSEDSCIPEDSGSSSIYVSPENIVLRQNGPKISAPIANKPVNRKSETIRKLATELSAYTFNDDFIASEVLEKMKEVKRLMLIDRDAARCISAESISEKPDTKEVFQSQRHSSTDVRKRKRKPVSSSIAGAKEFKNSDLYSEFSLLSAAELNQTQQWVDYSS